MEELYLGAFGNAKFYFTSPRQLARDRTQGAVGIVFTSAEERILTPRMSFLAVGVTH